MRGDNKLINLFKATRFRRCLPSLMAILIFPALIQKISPPIFTLMITVASFYSLTSIHNAYKDKDYLLPKYFPIILITGILITIAIAATNKFILITSVIAIILGYTYNTLSRFIILGDSIVAGITHYVLPILTSALILNTNPLPITPIFFFFMFSLMPISNLKDIQKDKDLGYKTLVGSVKNPLWIATLFSNLAFITTAIIFYILKINSLFLIPLFIFQLLITFTIHTKRKIALELTRLYLTTIFATIIINLTSSSKILIPATIVLAIHLTLFSISTKKLIK